ncbi:phospholipase/carboxylesterase [Catalinimonas alkaloidigena]|uniref:Phospholipase/carboxylesterase n=1 Tax=Catalinimonas alkaloidigena TaxID=1075417 RepID=A0A1G9TGE5_9BACT|nr:phospholipase [Catalinimonas alkaloidigena]SDM46682.1 phospholipase/carboxylesterase [Catalinimonas alkaloidigena]
MIIHNERVARGGVPLDKADRVLILVHGRGATADGMLPLGERLATDQLAYLAPQAIGHTWYPNSFLAPLAKNEPYLSNSLSMLEELRDNLEGLGFPDERLYWLGFSQGACLMLEFCARHARRFGGIVGLTGGLLGETVDRSRYRGDFAGTPVFLGTSDPDPHVPRIRVDETEMVLTEMGAHVRKKVYPGMGHTIHPEELVFAQGILDGTF